MKNYTISFTNKELISLIFVLRKIGGSPVVTARKYAMSALEKVQNKLGPELLEKVMTTSAENRDVFESSNGGACYGMYFTEASLKVVNSVTQPDIIEVEGVKYKRIS